MLEMYNFNTLYTHLKQTHICTERDKERKRGSEYGEMYVCISQVARGTLQQVIRFIKYRCGRDEKSAWNFEELLYKTEKKLDFRLNIKSRSALFLTPIITSHSINYI